MRRSGLDGVAHRLATEDRLVGQDEPDVRERDTAREGGAVVRDVDPVDERLDRLRRDAGVQGVRRPLGRLGRCRLVLHVDVEGAPREEAKSP